MRHRHRHELVRHHDRLGRPPRLAVESREGFDERGEVGPRVAEEHVDPAVFEELEVGVGGGFGLECLQCHECLLYHAAVSHRVRIAA